MGIGDRKLKCWVHPKVDAVAVCKSCGRGVCQECAVILEGDAYCKTCVEAGKIPVPTATRGILAPKGIPSRAFFVIGGIGSIINASAAILIFISALGTLFSGWYYGEALSGWFILGIIGGILLAIGLVLSTIGYLGIQRNYASNMGLVSFIFGIISSMIFVIEIVITIALWGTIVYPYPYPYYGYIWPILIVTVITLIIFGVTQILWGVTHIVSRKFTGKPDLSMTTGIMLIIAGALSLSIMISFIGMILFCVSEIMALALFFTSKIPASKPA